jgi:hypothetical protein
VVKSMQVSRSIICATVSFIFYGCFAFGLISFSEAGWSCTI